jgi:DUF4097 and DUF4098 domain-containing protein YvlB
MEFRFFVLVAALLTTGSIFAGITEVETFSYPLNEGGRFSVSNVNGSITITGVSGNSVEIVATKKADNQEDLDKIEIDIDHSASAIEIETDLGDSHSWFSHRNNSGEVTYVIAVPETTNLDSVETVNGDIRIGGVAGMVVAESVNGELNITDLENDVSLATVNGSVNADFSKCNGDQSVKAETVNGRITIALPENADVEVSADTLNGGINGGEFNLQTDKGFVGSDLNGKIGSGSARLNIDTVNGSIKIRKN